MKKSIFPVFVAFLALVFVSCSDNNGDLVNGYVRPDAVKLVSHPDTVLSDWEKEKKIAGQNIAISKAQEIPVGDATFNKLVSFIWKHGFIIPGGPDRIPCGRQYTFYDSHGNRHGMLATKIDTVANKASMTGTVTSIVVYGYRAGIKNQEHFFPYDINKEKVFCPILEIDGSWPDADKVKFGYEEFLKKVLNSK